VALTLGELAERTGVQVQGDAAVAIDGVCTLQDGRPDCISFLANPKYAAALTGTQAGAVILHETNLAACPCDALVLPNPYLGYAQLSHHFDPAPKTLPGIHPSAVVDPSAVLGVNVSIAAGAVIEAGVVLGDGVSVGPNCVIGAHSRVGAGTRFRANVTLYHGVIVGQRCNFHSGVVLGADGFGFAPDKGRWHKIAQIGSVEIGDDVDVGANTTIDRGALENTVIGNGVILDNQIQIAHNCVIGDFTAIAGCTGIAGSTRIGKHCMIAGGVGIAGHLEICDRVHLMMMCQVTRSITEPGAYASGTALSEEKGWKKSVARFRHLDDLARRIQQLEREMAALRGSNDKIL